jgi:hypothetical protein
VGELVAAAGSAPTVTNPAKAMTVVTKPDRNRPRALIGRNLSRSLSWRGTLSLVRPIFLGSLLSLGIVPCLGLRSLDSDSGFELW